MKKVSAPSFFSRFPCEIIPCRTGFADWPGCKTDWECPYGCINNE